MHPDDFQQSAPQTPVELATWRTATVRGDAAVRSSVRQMRVECPECHGEVTITEAMLDESESNQIACPTCGEAFQLDANQTVYVTGDTLQSIGRFGVLDVLGQGAFGTVYLGRDDELDRLVAIKVPDTDAFRGKGMELFLAEARAAAQLSHPAIVTIYDVGHWPDGTSYVVMEYIEGRSLMDAMSQQPWPAKQAAKLMCRLAEAAHYAHTMGLVHRDLKPANILLDKNGAPHIADFGLAVRKEDLPSRKGEVSGTPAYMAPEQVRGESDRCSNQTDVWSLGVMLYELLTGRLPFGVPSVQSLFQDILHRQPTPIREIARETPEELERICARCLAKPMANRYPTAAALDEDLQRFLSGGAPTFLDTM